MYCDCCEVPLRFQWSDTHGVGVCVNCGLPYTILHYENVNGQQKRVEKSPVVALNASGVEIAKRYWHEQQMRVFPACYDMGIGRNDRSYSGATPEECEAFKTWYEAHKAEFPKDEAA